MKFFDEFFYCQFSFTQDSTKVAKRKKIFSEPFQHRLPNFLSHLHPLTFFNTYKFIKGRFRKSFFRTTKKFKSVKNKSNITRRIKKKFIDIEEQKELNRCHLPYPTPGGKTTLMEMSPVAGHFNEETQYKMLTKLKVWLMIEPWLVLGLPSHKYSIEHYTKTPGSMTQMSSCSCCSCHLKCPTSVSKRLTCSLRKAGKGILLNTALEIQSLSADGIKLLFLVNFLEKKKKKKENLLKKIIPPPLYEYRRG